MSGSGVRNRRAVFILEKKATDKLSPPETRSSRQERLKNTFEEIEILAHTHNIKYSGLELS